MERTIRLCYRKLIDAGATAPWEKQVFDDTYTEYRMQVQLYNRNQPSASFSELLLQVPGAAQLPFLVSSAAIPYIRQLNGKIPDIRNALGRIFLPFQHFHFEIIHSDTRDRNRHAVAINFYSDPLTWYDTIGNQLLLGAGTTEQGERLTDLLTLQPYLSIYAIL